jgi:radical SAM superfamily enzyme YgiQ (UPF0313 family)
MNVVLVNPPNHRQDVDDLAPPLGLLMLAQDLIEIGFGVTLVDLNLDSCRNALPAASDFYPLLCERVLKLDPDVVCFTSMGINSHVALELARQLKQIAPSLVTVFGGAHFASIAFELTQRFWWVDYVVTGAGEGSLEMLVSGLHRGERFASPVITRRRNDPTATAFRHPWNAYSTIRLADYFSVNPRRVLNFETGRGCKFKCRFCYSPAHWTEKFDFEMSHVIEDIKAASRIGANHLFFVQDNLLNDRRSASALCLNLADVSPKPSWNCYGTLRDIDEEMPSYLARGGCVSIYIGIDATTPAQKREFGKTAFNSEDECLEKVRTLVANSVVPTCAFILDPINWSDEEIEATFRLATTLRLNGAEISLHFLTTYSNTGLNDRLLQTRTWTPDDFRIRLMFDCPDVVIENSFATDHPSLFPFHRRSAGDTSSYRRAVALVHLAQHIISVYPYEASDLISNAHVKIIDVLRTVYDNCPSSLWHEPALSKTNSGQVFEELLRRTYGFVSASSN